jgi:hypothetical protein
VKSVDGKSESQVDKKTKFVFVGSVSVQSDSACNIVALARQDGMDAWLL